MGFIDGLTVLGCRARCVLASMSCREHVNAFRQTRIPNIDNIVQLTKYTNYLLVIDLLSLFRRSAFASSVAG
jgi:hypothetical protein